ncbi:uncharacterized protein LOC123923794 [Trifolium pratense]|uniref:uncharacterized protein LOC123923794 n=1 Tax=Trifolium pratense TaxID=57577 RepID=UPI001E69360D|nr:uncharacterized protein LOC123923794 [Trifolium pratense]
MDATKTFIERPFHVEQICRLESKNLSLHTCGWNQFQNSNSSSLLFNIITHFLYHGFQIFSHQISHPSPPSLPSLSFFIIEEHQKASSGGFFSVFKWKEIFVDFESWMLYCSKKSDRGGYSF